MPKKQPPQVEHPRVAYLLALSGLAGLGIAAYDHKLLWIAFLTSWGAALGVIAAYFSPWRVTATAWWRKKPLRQRAAPVTEQIIAMILLLVYLTVPVQMYLQPPPKFEVYVDDYGVFGQATWLTGNLQSFNGTRASYMFADGSRIIEDFGKDYKLIGVVFFRTRSIDVLDEPNISKSGVYDLSNRRIQIIIPWNDTFLDELIMKGHRGAAYTLLAIPPKVANEPFNSVRDAVKVGAVIVQQRGGPP